MTNPDRPPSTPDFFSMQQTFTDHQPMLLLQFKFFFSRLARIILNIVHCYDGSGEFVTGIALPLRVEANGDVIVIVSGDEPTLAMPQFVQHLPDLGSDDPLVALL